MKPMVCLCLASLLSPLVMNAQQKLPTATPMLTPAICGKAVYDLWLGDKSVGREEFEIKCKPDGGYQASGHTGTQTHRRRDRPQHHSRSGQVWRTVIIYG